VSQSRELNASWHLVLQSASGFVDDGEPASASFELPGEWAATVGSSDVHSRTVPDRTATANAVAQVSWDSFVGADRISFETRATAVASGSATEPATFIAAGGGASTMRVFFDVATPTAVSVRWTTDFSSNGGRLLAQLTRGSEFVFFLGGDASSIGLGRHSFEDSLLLQPGRYDLLSQANAGSFASSVPVSGQDQIPTSTVFAAFSITAVPEPVTWILMVSGLVLLAARANRCRGIAGPDTPGCKLREGEAAR